MNLMIFINIEYGNIYFFIINPIRFLDVTHISFFLFDEQVHPTPLRFEAIAFHRYIYAFASIHQAHKYRIPLERALTERTKKAE